jgi:hypothetical protein
MLLLEGDHIVFWEGFGMSAGLLVGLLFALIVFAGLVVLGVVSIRKGSRELARQRMTDAAHAVWHRQLAFVFGVNNLVFAGLVAAIVLLMLATGRTLTYVAVALIALLLVMSLILVGRCVLVALQTSRDALMAQQRKRDSHEELP